MRIPGMIQAVAVQSLNSCIKQSRLHSQPRVYHMYDHGEGSWYIGACDNIGNQLLLHLPACI